MAYLTVDSAGLLQRDLALLQAASDERVSQAAKNLRKVASSYPYQADHSRIFVPDRSNVVKVGQYLLAWAGLPYWTRILLGGVPGLSLWLHEVAELHAYRLGNRDPFLSSDQSEYYPIAHSLALVVEHSLLQAIAQSNGLNVSLRMLIEYNPHGDPPSADWEGDWQLVERVRGPALSAAERSFDVRQTSKVRRFYWDLGFQRLT